MLMTTSYIVVDKKDNYDTWEGNTTNLEYVSLNEFNKSPIVSKSTSMYFSFGVGSIIDEKFQEQYKYFDHKYELASVLGEDKENQKLLVYGAKIGEKIISTQNDIFHNYTFYQRGDLLLLKQLDTSNKFSIIYNIDQLRLKAERDEFGQRAR